MSATTRIKICGLARVADLRAAERAGADYVGAIVEVPWSPRAVTVAQAAALRRAARLPWVCVTVSQDPVFCRSLLSELRPAALQLHGLALLEVVQALSPADRGETELWACLGVPAAGSAPPETLPRLLAEAQALAAAGVQCLVLDTAAGKHSGGTGRTLAWALAAGLAQAAESPRLFLAGGLGPDNVAEAIAAVRPYGVDASSRLERAPGVKSPHLVTEFVAAVRAAHG